LSLEARLRIDPGDGSAVADYRLVDGIVETRTLDPAGRIDPWTGSPWEQLEPEDLAAHVESNTAVARWLERRMGFRALLRACQSGFAPEQFSRHEEPTRAA
jgi:hypothetical protein